MCIEPLPKRCRSHQKKNSTAKIFKHKKMTLRKNDIQNPEDILKKAKHYCAYQERCTQDVERKLAGWGVDESRIPELINRLKKENFLSDSRFAKLFTEAKINRYRWGKMKIIAALKAKNIPEQIIDREMEKIEPEIYERNIRFLMDKKSKELKGVDPLIKKSKLLHYLYSKGYAPETINRFINQ